MKYRVVIIETETLSVTEEFKPCKTLLGATRLEDGVMINLDHSKYYTDIQKVQDVNPDTIRKALAKYFFVKGIESDMDQIICKETGIDHTTYYYKKDKILSVDYSMETVISYYEKIIN